VGKGQLFLVATPIGNLDDINHRALETLRVVDVIACEDTRHTNILLQHWGIETPRISYHDHNKERRTPELLNRVQSGQKIAVVTDAGTPGIQDPGVYLVRKALERRIEPVVIPGPSALILGLVVSGLATDRFAFEGFLPAKKGRNGRLASLAEEPRTLVFYEAPHRVGKTLSDLLQVLGDRRAALARELTKKFEEVQRGTISQLIEMICEAPPRGEYVIVVEGLKEHQKRNRKPQGDTECTP
jgi:16S rRNA (cytidine1402-2'-O)-methyltransferase